MAAVLAFGVALTFGGAGAEPSSRIQTVFVIVFENTNWADVLNSSSAPYINSVLASASRDRELFF